MHLKIRPKPVTDHRNLQVIDQMCEKTDTEMPRITLSEIDYR